jgi:ferredoxin
MPRKIVRIDEERCDGCGVCVTACAEGALAIVDGKARLTGEIFCDGFGDCVGECPQGAMTIVEEDAPAYDPVATRAHVATIGGAEAVRRFDEAARAHSGCPGSRMSSAPGVTQWPIQLHLIPPQAPFFRGKELVVLNTCGAVASRNLHETVLDGRSVVVGCPKLDDTRPYAAKLAAILSDPTIPRAIVVRMEVPCCGGLTALTRMAAGATGRSDLEVAEVVLGVDGKVRH